MTQDKGNVLLLYPALFKIAGLHLGIASLSGVLKEAGYNVKVFDTAFYDLAGQKEWDKERAERLMSKEIINENDRWQVKATDVKKDLIELIEQFQPKVVGVSVTEPTYQISLMLTRLIKERYPDLIILAGGAFPTLSPDIVIKENSIDIVCLGEGETAFLELCDRVYNNQDFYDIEGLWVKKQNEIYKNNPGKLPDVNQLPHLDFSVFKDALFYKPMQGRLYKMVNIETSRGCPYNCTYCSSCKLKELAQTYGCGSYYRNLKMEKVIDQIHHQISRHSPEFIFFVTETFLAMDEKDFEMFIKEYAKIKLPFWIQTRFETITEAKIRALQEVGMFWLTLGVEHGNERFRRNILNRNYSDEEAIRGVSTLEKCGIGASLNNMIGLPLENRELIFDTIKLNKRLFEINDKLEFNVFMYVPYRGSELYDLCQKKGLLPQNYSIVSSLNDESVLNFSKEYKKELSGLMKTFNLYIKLPEKYWPQIKIAESDNEEATAMFNRLSQLLGK